jgi:hypothetical protein
MVLVADPAAQCLLQCSDLESAIENLARSSGSLSRRSATLVYRDCFFIAVTCPLIF